MTMMPSHATICGKMKISHQSEKRPKKTHTHWQTNEWMKMVQYQVDLCEICMSFPQFRHQLFLCAEYLQLICLCWVLDTCVIITFGWCCSQKSSPIRYWLSWWKLCHADQNTDWFAKSTADLCWAMPKTHLLTWKLALMTYIWMCLFWFGAFGFEQCWPLQQQ